MAYEFIASGGLLDATQFSSYESRLAEGDRALLELNLRLPVSQGVANELESKLKQAGVKDVRVTTASPLLRIYFTKGFPWLTVIAAIILGILMLVIMITGWSLFKQVMPKELIPVVGTLGLVVLIGLGIMLLARRQ